MLMQDGMHNLAVFEEWAAGFDGAAGHIPVLLAAGRALAAELDADRTNASLWREYRALIEMLVRGADDGDGDSDIERLLAEMSAPLGDAEAG